VKNLKYYRLKAGKSVEELSMKTGVPIWVIKLAEQKLQNFRIPDYIDSICEELKILPNQLCKETLEICPYCHEELTGKAKVLGRRFFIDWCCKVYFPKPSPDITFTLEGDTNE
jgi:hypothetical protein